MNAKAQPIGHEHTLDEPQRNITGPDGWLSPEGLFYPCAHYGHITLAYLLGFDPRPQDIGQITRFEIEQAGWVKVSADEFYRWSTLDPTQCQLDMIFDYCMVNKVALPPWMKNKTE